MCIRVFSSTTCRACKAVKSLLDNMGVEYEEVLIDKQPDAQIYLARKFGAKSVPVIETDNDVFIGYQPSAVKQFILKEVSRNG